MSSEIQNLLKTMPQSGKVDWIGLRPGRRQPMQHVKRVQADVEQGLIGDRFKGGRGAARQVTLIQHEHLAVIASILRKPIAPELLRRNLVVSGINLLALKKSRFKIGEAILEMTGHCQPCSRMEELLGAGGYNAVRGHGGITARVIESGAISVQDRVSYLVANPMAPAK